MKKLFLFIIFFSVSTAHGFWSNTELEREDMKIQINITPDKTWGEIVEKIKNPTDLPIEIQYFYPFSASTKNIQLFQNSARVSTTLQTGNTRKETILNQAMNLKDYRFFRFYDPNYPQLLQSESITIPPYETKTLKLSFEQNNFKKETFLKSDFFLNDEILSQNFEIGVSLESTQPIRHFYTNLPSTTQIEQNEKDITWVFSAQNYTSTKNPFILFSNDPNPILETQINDYAYTAHFLEKNPPQKQPEISFLIDRSGSFSDGKWKRVIDWMHYFLKNFEENTKLRVAFFNEKTQVYNEEWKPNNFEFQKPFFNYMTNIQPVGKTDISQAFESIKEKWMTENKTMPLLFLITDDPNTLPIYTLQTPIIALNFGDIENDLSRSAYKSGGFAIKLFQSAIKLIEKSEWEQKWKHWNTRYNKEVVLEETEKELFPQSIRIKDTPQSPFRVGRVFGKKTKTEFPFIARFWGQQRIANIIESQDFSDSNMDVVLALGRIFGIQTNLFHDQTRRNELRKSLENLSDTERFYLVQNLREEQNLYSRFKYYDTDPVYNVEDDIWQVFNFNEKAQDETTISIAPYSEAQAYLFRQFPDLMWQGFGLAEEIDFCAPFRCLSLRKNNRTVHIPFDRAFFKDYDPNHWANEYLKKAIKLGLLEPELNGKIHADRGIDRGEFIQMVHKYIYNSRFLLKKDPVFSDIPTDSEFFTSTQFLFAKNIIQGYEDQSFRPLQTLTRAEGVKILLASDGFTPSEADKSAEAIFPDSQQWEKAWVNEAFKRGIVRGKNENEFKPHDPLTRAEALKILLNSR